MKIYVFALLVVAAVAFAHQLPVEDLNEDEVPLDILNLPVASEDKSVEVKPVEEHRPELALSCVSPCAAHCVLKGYGGGKCNTNGICVCR